VLFRSSDVEARSEIMVATKADSAIEENLAEFEAYAKAHDKPFVAISSLTKGGVSELLSWIEKILVATKAQSDLETT
jgi:GTPase involved in cell partitioning and DNA repair